MSFRTMAVTGSIVLLALDSAHATPDPAPGAEALCAGYEEVVEGVWMDASGWEMLRFRFARNADGNGCYAWLNRVSKWNISAPGMNIAEVRLEGEQMIWGNDQNGVHVDLATGDAPYIRNGRRTRGKLLE